MHAQLHTSRLAHRWTGGFPSGHVTHRPTVQELEAIASSLSFSPSTAESAPRLLPHMLEQVPYSKASVVLAQYTPDRDPYEYRAYCAEMDARHTSSNGWLPNVARLLICWMAEELRKVGVGHGPTDHFAWRAPRFRRAAGSLRAAPVVADETLLDGLLDYYANEMDPPPVAVAVVPPPIFVIVVVPVVWQKTPPLHLYISSPR